ncbi:glycosyltransferase [Polynucleobacter paneuropaeus]|nr:glycosyltransferase [Polynucleobacter paneuropaeus]
MSLKSPLVTVLMPVFNGKAYLKDSIDSILSQDFHDYELLIINDGSKDCSLNIIKLYQDPRIYLISQINQGLARSLNNGLKIASGKYIIRQDQDDISLPTRISKQVAYLEENPECALVGTRAQIYEGDTKSNRFHDHPTNSGELSFDLIFNNPFVHSSVAFRKDEVIDLGGYSEDPERQPPEDYELWSRISRSYKVANLPERLVLYRESKGSMSRVSAENPFTKKLVTISAENLANACGLLEVDQACKDFGALTHSDPASLSANPDLEKISGYVRKAASNIGEKFRGAAIDERAESRIRTLRYQYLLNKSRSKYFQAIVNKARSLVRKIRR